MLNQLLWQKCWNSLLVDSVILLFISSMVKEDRPTVTTFTSALLSWNYSFSSIAVLFSCSDFTEHRLSTVSNYRSLFHVHFEVPYVGRPQASRCRPNRTVICVFSLRTECIQILPFLLLVVPLGLFQTRYDQRSRWMNLLDPACYTWCEIWFLH